MPIEALSHVWLGDFRQHLMLRTLFPTGIHILSTMSNSTSNPPSGASTPSNSRFISNTETLEDALKTQTVGLVHLSEFKKRRVELAEQREREAAEKLQAAHTSRAGTSSREGSEQPPAKKKKRKVVAKGKLSFGGVEDEDEDETDSRGRSVSIAVDKVESMDDSVDSGGAGLAEALVESEAARKRKVNPKLRAPPPKVLTKNTLLREAQERETLRREFLVLQEKIKNEEISIPFVFYDGMFYSLTMFLYPGQQITNDQSCRNKCRTTRWRRRTGQERGSSMAFSRARTQNERTPGMATSFCRRSITGSGRSYHSTCMLRTPRISTRSTCSVFLLSHVDDLH